MFTDATDHPQESEMTLPNMSDYTPNPMSNKLRTTQGQSILDQYTEEPTTEADEVVMVPDRTLGKYFSQ